MNRVLIGLLAVALAGCATKTQITVNEAQKCAPSASMLAACDDVSPIKEGITFGELVKASGRDREALRACALRQKHLAETITDCNSRIDKYNAEIREINARNAAQQ